MTTIIEQRPQRETQTVLGLSSPDSPFVPTLGIELDNLRNDMQSKLILSWVLGTGGEAANQGIVDLWQAHQLAQEGEYGTREYKQHLVSARSWAMVSETLQNLQFSLLYEQITSKVVLDNLGVAVETLTENTKSTGIGGLLLDLASNNLETARFFQYDQSISSRSSITAILSTRLAAGLQMAVVKGEDPEKVLQDERTLTARLNKVNPYETYGSFIGLRNLAEKTQQKMESWLAEHLPNLSPRQRRFAEGLIVAGIGLTFIIPYFLNIASADAAPETKELGSDSSQQFSVEGGLFIDALHFYEEHLDNVLPIQPTNPQIVALAREKLSLPYKEGDTGITGVIEDYYINQLQKEGGFTPQIAIESLVLGQLYARIDGAWVDLRDNNEVDSSVVRNALFRFLPEVLSGSGEWEVKPTLSPTEHPLNPVEDPTSLEEWDGPIPPIPAELIPESSPIELVEELCKAMDEGEVPIDSGINYKVIFVLGSVMQPTLSRGAISVGLKHGTAILVPSEVKILAGVVAIGAYLDAVVRGTIEGPQNIPVLNSDGTISYRKLTQAQMTLLRQPWARNIDEIMFASTTDAGDIKVEVQGQEGPLVDPSRNPQDGIEGTPVSPEEASPPVDQEDVEGPSEPLSNSPFSDSFEVVMEVINVSEERVHKNYKAAIDSCHFVNWQRAVVVLPSTNDIVIGSFARESHVNLMKTFNDARSEQGLIPISNINLGEVFKINDNPSQFIWLHEQITPELARFLFAQGYIPLQPNFRVANTE